MNSSFDFSLTGRVIVLTGGGGILGSRIARALARHGACVAVVDRDEKRAMTVATEVNASYSSRPAVGYGVDITDRSQLEALRDRVEAELGLVDILVNNAAAKSPKFFEPFESFPQEDWDYVMRTNVTGAVLSCQLFGSRMAERQRGSIINTLSIYGIVAPDQRVYKGSMYQGQAINTPAVYSTSKAALWGLTRYLASYWGDRGVRVNAVTPGGVFSGQNDTFVAQYSLRVPLGRMAQADEICGAIVFLASDASSYVTGHNLVVDGGLTVW